MNNRQLMRKETLMGSSLEFRQLLGGCLTVRDDILLELNKDNVITINSIKKVMLDCLFALKGLGFNIDGLFLRLDRSKVLIKENIDSHGYENMIGAYKDQVQISV